MSRDGGEFVALAASRSYRFGASPDCEVQLGQHAPPGSEPWFQLRHAGVWSIRPAAGGVEVFLDGSPLPGGRATSLDFAQIRTIQVRARGTAVTVRLSEAAVAAAPARAEGAAAAPRWNPPPAAAPAPAPGYAAPSYAAAAPAYAAPAHAPAYAGAAPGATAYGGPSYGGPPPASPPPYRTHQPPVPPSITGSFSIPSGGRWATPPEQLLRIGRAGGSADIQVGGDDVALVHAEVKWRGTTLQVTDRSRGLGVHVRGTPVLVARVKPGEQFIIGHHIFTVGEQELRLTPIVQAAAAAPGVAKQPSLVLSNLVGTYKGNPRPTLNDVSFAVPEGSVVAVMGPSGAGKSSTCRVLLGEMENVQGIAWFKGADLTRNRGLWQLISFVPQDEALPKELTVEQALDFVARLRLSKDLDKASRTARVNQVLESVELDGHKEKAISALSGGQRKRASVAMELLSDPVLLILDEPTSGLDEGLDLRMMELMRRLAEEKGMTVFIITHSMANLDQANFALAMNTKGQVGFFGPPERLVPSFHVDGYSDVMNALREGKAGDVPPVTPPPQAPPVDGSKAKRRNVTGTLLLRELARMKTKPVGLGINLLLAPLLITGIAGSADTGGLLARPLPADTAAIVSKVNNPHTVLAVLTICLAFIATQTSFSSIVVDRAMILRESRWGLSIGSVLWSRAIPAFAIAGWQAVFSFSIFALWRDLPEHGQIFKNLPFLELVISLVLVAWACSAVGLLLSASSPTVERAVFGLMGAAIVMVTLCGLMIAFGDPKLLFDKGASFGGYFSPTRWGVAGVAATIDLRPALGGKYCGHLAAAMKDSQFVNNPRNHNPLPNKTDLLQNPLNTCPRSRLALDAMWTGDATHVLTAWGVLFGMVVLLVGLSGLSLRKFINQRV